MPIVSNELKTAKMKIQLTIDTLKKIIHQAEIQAGFDSSLSTTVEIALINECDTHTGSDQVGVKIKSGFQECDGKWLNIYCALPEAREVERLGKLLAVEQSIIYHGEFEAQQASRQKPDYGFNWGKIDGLRQALFSHGLTSGAIDALQWNFQDRTGQTKAA